MVPIYASTTGVVQTKLAVNRPGDEFEQEADRVAESVMRASEPQVQRQCACGGGCADCQRDEEEQRTVRLKAGGGGGTTPAEAPESVQDVLRAPGRPLDASTRLFMESRFGHDFGGVRVHTDEAARRTSTEMNALAYTVGSNIAFGPGQYNPGSAAGRDLLAHELTHVVQQSRGRQPVSGSGFDFTRIPLYSNLAPAAPGRMVQRRDAAPEGHKSGTPGRKFSILFTYHRSSSGTAVLSDGTEVTVAVTLNTHLPGMYRLERHNEIPGDYKYLIFRLDPKSGDKQGTQVNLGSMHWTAKVPAADEVFLTIASDETAAFFRYMADPAGIKLSVADRAHIAIAIQSGGIRSTDWYELRREGSIKPRTSAQAVEMVDQWIKDRDQHREIDEKTESVLSESAVQTMELGGGLDESMTGVYRDYQQLQKLARLTPNDFGDFKKAYPEGWERLLNVGGPDYKDELTARIEKQLQVYGIGGIPEFEKRIELFETAFRAYSVHTGLHLMEEAYRVCDRFLVEAQNVQYSTGWNEKGKIMAASLQPERKALQDRVEAAEEHADKTVRKLMNSLPWETQSPEDFEAEMKAAKAEKTGALDQVAALLPQFPFIGWPDFPRERLLNKTDPSDVMDLVIWYLIEHKVAIKKARQDLESKPKRVYKLDILLHVSKEKLGISEGSIFDLIVADEEEAASQDSLISRIETALLFALMIASAVVTGGASIAVSFAIAGLSAAQAYDLYTEYNTQLAAHRANLSSVEPSELWVIVAIAGAAMDFNAAFEALSASAKLRNAVNEFSKTRKLDEFTKELDRLSHLPNPEISEEAARAIEAKAGDMVHGAAPAADSAVVNAVDDAENVAAREADTVTADTPELMAELEEGKLTETESAAKGHKIKITAKGKIVRCTTCGELAQKYSFILQRDSKLRQELVDLETKAQAAAAAGNRRALSTVARQTRNLEQKIIEQGVREVENLWKIEGRLIDSEGLRAAIAEHPEDIARQMEDRAEYLESQNLASGEERLGSVGTHQEGVPREVRDRLRGKTPSDAIKARVRGSRTPPFPDDVLRGLTVTEALEADHIVAMDRILQMPGFAQLSEEDMLAVLNHPDNFIGLSRAANGSKGSRTFYDWIIHSSSDTLVDPVFRERMALEELRLETELEREIQRRLRRARFAAGSP